ncbi:hypothetical protein HPB52_015136 [Rhipicephalus sanguineus]|uniref:Uncharacterized protein n=1 Tax=Rhipicephalus sanguineus TaxID=34632 RepID=A0A9D4TAI5_RHISA|nr:hypothetical protein HPB52_015136 [Rhipicephalus sanguineus]
MASPPVIAASMQAQTSAFGCIQSQRGFDGPGNASFGEPAPRVDQCFMALHDFSTTLRTTASARTTVTSHHVDFLETIRSVSYRIPSSGPGSSTPGTMLNNPFCFAVQLLAGTGTLAAPRASDPDFTAGFLALPQSQAGDQSTSEEPVPVESRPPAPAPPSETPAPERRYPSRQRRPFDRYEARF